MDEIIALWHRLLDDQSDEETRYADVELAIDGAIRNDPALVGKPIEDFPLDVQDVHFEWLLVRRRIVAAQERLLILLDGRVAPLGDQRYLVPIEGEGEAYLTEMDSIQG